MVTLAVVDSQIINSRSQSIGGIRHMPEVHDHLQFVTETS